MPVVPRRRLLLATAAVVAAPAWLTPALAQGPALRPTPRQTEGPFYPVSLPADSDADLLRNGQVVYGQGQPAWVEGTVTDLAGVPVSGAVVEIWQCDHQGHYHHPGDGNRADPAFQGFGRVNVGRDGRYRFRTLKPVPYAGRTPHITSRFDWSAASCSPRSSTWRATQATSATASGGGWTSRRAPP
jgi:protocatechuate 3,4-dioxygenase, beta subunit